MRVGLRPTAHDSRREYHLDMAQRERTGFGSRGLGFEPSCPDAMRGGGTGTTPRSEPGGPRSNRGLAALGASAVVDHVITRLSRSVAHPSIR